ncbi:hypothetical protein GW17_00017516 [Ensete ventricosum]|nr:hypothetical protein GW17_00017516 [Ensete ventricosum]
MYRVNAVGNSLGVRREFTKGIGSLPGWRKGVCQNKIETHRKIIGGSRTACRESFTEGIGKLAGNMLGDCRKKIIGLVARMSEVAELTGGLVFTQRRSVVDAGVPQGLGSGRRLLAPNHYKN